MLNDNAPANNARECHEQCNQTENCNYWDWDEDGPYCRLRSEAGNGPQYDHNATGGKKNCAFPTTTLLGQGLMGQQQLY